MMEGMPESAEVNLLAAERIIGNAVDTDNDYMKTTYRYLNNLYARWNSFCLRWYIIFSGCAAETCDSRSRWSSMRGLHFFYTTT